jgi:Tfp pilus assembly PilM family ATPase
MYTALNISSHNIKVLSLKGKRVYTWASADLTPGLVRDGQILKPEALGKAIDSLFKSNDIPRTNVIVGIAGLPFTHRFISLPRLKSSLAKEAILRTAKKEISLPLDELYVSWQSVNGKGEEQKYFVLGVPRHPVDTVLQTLKIANVEPYLIELQPLALARAANRGEAIIVNMEPDCFDIVLVTNGLPTVIHTVNPRSEGATLEDNIHRLAQELTKIVAYNQSNNPDLHISSSTPLLLTGELAADAIASKLLQSEIEYPLEPLVPPVELPDNLPIAPYTTSIGLALKRTAIKPSLRGEDSYFTDINIDILADKYLKPKTKLISIKNLLLTIFLVVVVGIIFPLYQMRANVITDNKVLETNLSTVMRQLDLATRINDETVSTENQIDEINATTNALEAANENILGTRGDFNTGLQRIISLMPSKTYFTSIEILKDGITIQGEADDVFTVINYATALEAEGIFTEVHITQLDENIVTVPVTGETEPTPSQVTLITFEIVCKK